MMDLATMNEMSDQAAIKASEEERLPFVYWDISEVDKRLPFPFPFIGSYVPKGWVSLKSVVPMLCDTSGMGLESEPALTDGQLRVAIKALISENPKRTLGFAITEVGQFQCYVQAYYKIKRRGVEGSKVDAKLARAMLKRRNGSE